MPQKKFHKKRILKDDAGVSLIEVLIAVAIFAIGISAVAVLQYKTVGGNTRGRMITDATTLAQQEIERLMELDYTDTDLDAGGHTAAGTPAPYTINWDVREVELNGVAPAESKLIKLWVTAPQLGGNRDISIVYFKTSS